jgi:hypothetical protein
MPKQKNLFSFFNRTDNASILCVCQKNTFLTIVAYYQKHLITSNITSFQSMGN